MFKSRVCFHHLNMTACHTSGSCQQNYVHTQVRFYFCMLCPLAAVITQMWCFYCHYWQVWLVNALLYEQLHIRSVSWLLLLWLTCVWDESLQVSPCTLVLQHFLRRQVCEQHLQDGLGVLTVPGVGVPNHAVAQQRLWEGWKVTKKIQVNNCHTFGSGKDCFFCLFMLQLL